MFQSFSPKNIFIYLPTNAHNRAIHNSRQLKSIKGLNWWDEFFIVFIEKDFVIKIIRSTDGNYPARHQKSIVQIRTKSFHQGNQHQKSDSFLASRQCQEDWGRYHAPTS